MAGREVAALGTSVIRNTADGRAPLKRLVLPLWIGRVYVTTSPRVSVQPRRDLATTASTLVQAFDPRSRLDVARSVSAGAPVFLVYADVSDWVGYQRAGVVLLHYPEDYRGMEEEIGGDVLNPIERSRRARARARAAAGQAFLLFTAPAGDWLVDRSRATARIHRWVDPGVVTAALNLPEVLIPYERRPWEREADFLARLTN